MMRFQGLLCVVLLLTVSIFAPAAAAAGDWYLHDDPELLWYWHKNPRFEIAVPYGPASWSPRYVFGEQFLEFVLAEDTTPIITVGVVSSEQADVESLREALVGRWSYQLANITVDADQTLESSLGLEFYFHLVSGDAPDGKRVMLRSVFYEREDSIVYLTLVTYSDEYAVDSFVRKAWLEAVNSFRWQ